jgi:hypothetical protein
VTSQAWIAGERSAVIDRRYNFRRLGGGAESGIKAAKQVRATSRQNSTMATTLSASGEITVAPPQKAVRDRCAYGCPAILMAAESRLSQSF